MKAVAPLRLVGSLSMMSKVFNVRINMNSLPTRPSFQSEKDHGGFAIQVRWGGNRDLDQARVIKFN